MNYADKIALSRETYLNIGIQLGAQKMADYMAIALNDPKVLGKATLGERRLTLVFQRVKELDNIFEYAFNPKHPESDYVQEQFDKRLKQIFKEDFVPFSERYPFVKRQKY